MIDSAYQLFSSGTLNLRASLHENETWNRKHTSQVESLWTVDQLPTIHKMIVIGLCHAASWCQTISETYSMYSEYRVNQYLADVLWYKQKPAEACQGMSHGTKTRDTRSSLHQHNMHCFF